MLFSVVCNIVTVLFFLKILCCLKCRRWPWILEWFSPSRLRGWLKTPSWFHHGKRRSSVGKWHSASIASSNAACDWSLARLRIGKCSEHDRDHDRWSLSCSLRIGKCSEHCRDLISVVLCRARCWWYSRRSAHISTVRDSTRDATVGHDEQRKVPAQGTI